MKNKKICLLLILILFSGCKIKVSSHHNSLTSSSSNFFNNFTSEIKESTNSINNSNISSSCSNESDLSYNTNDITSIDLNNLTITNNNGGVDINEQIVNITKAGTYKICGTLEDGSVAINSAKEDIITLILDNVNISSNTNSPLYCLSADKLVIELVENSTNILTDSSSYIYVNETDQEPNACLFSKDDLTIKGNGNLIVNANFNNGIGTKDDLKIKSGNIRVTALNNALKGNDSVQISGGNINITSINGDGIKSDNEEDGTKGYINIDAGVLNIQAKYDGIQSSNYINITNGNFTIKTKNGSNGSISNSDTNSYKGIKAINDINISGGLINIDSLDDCIHSNKNVNINGGTMILSSSDDGIHGDEILQINEGNITITKSYEGLEAIQITIDGGNIYIKSSDDGINVAGGDGSNNDWRPGGGGGKPGWWRNKDVNLASSDITLDYVLTINGGYIYVDASGDGLDSNGNMYINGGLVIVNGPTNNGNGAIDIGDGGAKFEISGGTLIAAGSSGMAVGPTSASTQCSVKITLSSSMYSMISILDSNNEVIVAFKPAKTISSIVISSVELEKGSTYSLYINGTYDGGIEQGGLYSGGTYTKGTLKTTFTLSSTNKNLTVR